MATGESGISTKRAGVLLMICAVVAVGLFVLLHYMALTKEPLHDKDRDRASAQFPIQQRYNTDSLGKHKGKSSRTPTGGRMPSSLPTTAPDAP